MAPSLRTRLGALLMLLCFFGAGSGASAVDSFLFHLGNHRDVPLDHVESAGADCHAERCLAGGLVHVGQFLAAPTLGTVVRGPVETGPALPDRAVPVPQRRPPSVLPRSPPLLAL
jgi:hypothetical protein